MQTKNINLPITCSRDESLIQIKIRNLTDVLFKKIIVYVHSIGIMSECVPICTNKVDWTELFLADIIIL